MLPISFERRYLWGYPESKVKGLLAFWDFSRFSVHGDTQAVFEFDPPKSTMDQIYEAEDTPGQMASEDFTLGGKSGESAVKTRLSRTKTRKDSFGTVAGLTEHLTDFLQEHGGGDISNRLESLEEATMRIERLLVKLGQDLGDDASDVDPSVHRADTQQSALEAEAEAEGP